MYVSAFVGRQAIAVRGLDDTLARRHLEAAECCLLHTDNPQPAITGAYVNLNVRVGYNNRAYELVHPDGPRLTYSEIFTGLWRNRLAQWFTTPWFKEWGVRMSELSWEDEVPSARRAV